MDIGANYVLNGDKTEDPLLTAHLNCDPSWEYRQILDTSGLWTRRMGCSITTSSSLSSREYGLSVIMEGGPSKAVSYIEWLRQSKGSTHLSHHAGGGPADGYPGRHPGQPGSHRNGAAARQGLPHPLPAIQKVPQAHRISGAVCPPLCLGKVEKRQYPPKMTPPRKKEVIRFKWCPIPRAHLLEEKAGVCEQLAQVNREIWAARKKLAMCQEIQIESRENEVRQDARRVRPLASWCGCCCPAPRCPSGWAVPPSRIC